MATSGSDNEVDSTTNEEDIDFFKEISFSTDVQPNDLPAAQPYFPMPDREPRSRSPFSDRVQNLPSGLESHRQANRVTPAEHVSLLDRNNGDLDRGDRRSSRNRSTTPVYIINEDDLKKISPSGGKTVMQKVITANVVLLPKCILYPRISGGLSFGGQQRPPGCKTVSAKGFPTDVNKSVVEEVFRLGGDLDSVQMHGENAWHIRYVEGIAAENAIVLNTCHVQIDNFRGPPHSCQLQVIYTRTRVDQYEYQERVFEREVRARLGNELHYQASCTYSHREAANIVEKFRNGDSVSESLSIIRSWLDDGKLIDRNAYQFYVMLQSIKCYLRNLLNEKERRKGETSEENRKVQLRMHEVLVRSNIILLLFITVSDIGKNFFSRRQLDNLTLWKMEIINILNNFIRQRNFNQCNNLIRAGRSNAVVDTSNKVDEVDDATRINNMLKCVNGLLNQAQADQNIYERVLLTRDSDARSIQEHEDMQDLIWSVRAFYDKVSRFLRPAVNPQNDN